MYHKSTTTFLVLLFIWLHKGSSLPTLAQGPEPKPSETAKMARYIMHNTDWISIATISTIPRINSYPFVNLKSVSDGIPSNGSGVPYLLMTDMDLSGKDVLVDNRVSIMATLAEIQYCKSHNYDPQDPRCGRLLITGHLVKVTEDTDEHNFAKYALFTRHPSMKEWVLVHKFYIAKIDIEQIAVLDYFGGVKFVTLEDYFNVKPLSVEDANITLILV